jgi:threonine aldolase
MSGSPLDVRTDAITLPTDEMWDAMRSAQLGWAMAGEDPAVNALQARFADLTGKGAGLFVPTGTMANLVAVLTHTNPGQQVVLEASSHILWCEQWGLSAFGGLHHRAVAGDRGAMPLPDIRVAIEERRFGHRPVTGLLCLENTHNMAGGAVLTPSYTDAVCEVAHEHEVRVHLDGARLLNACAALGAEVHELTRSVDSVSVNLNKGLSGPMGCVLCGSRDFVARARVYLKRVGGWSISQAGIAAAAGLVAIERMRGQLAEDNARAARLAERIAGLDGFQAEPCETNIVMVRVEDHHRSDLLLHWLERRGIRVYSYRPGWVRLVTHRHVDDDAIDAIATAFAEFEEEVRDDR